MQKTMTQQPVEQKRLGGCQKMVPRSEQESLAFSRRANQKNAQVNISINFHTLAKAKAKSCKGCFVIFFHRIYRAERNVFIFANHVFQFLRNPTTDDFIPVLR